MAGASFVTSVVAPPDPNCGLQSVFCAAPALIEALGPAPPPLAKRSPRALIQLRDKDKLPIDFRDTEQTHRMRRRSAETNEAIGGLDIEMPVGVGDRHGDVLVIGGSCVNTGNTALFRIFNESFKNGGRFYGHFIQSLPKAIRAQLTIGGEPVAEPDFSAHHLRILYAIRGLPLRADEDPYIIDGWNRDLVKRAVLIIINASTLQSAIGAITQKFAIDRNTARNLVDDITRAIWRV
jgi:hypothetical protein